MPVGELATSPFSRDMVFALQKPFKKYSYSDRNRPLKSAAKA